MIKLEQAISKCQRLCKGVFWTTEGNPCNARIELNAIIAKTVVIVDENNKGLILLLCLKPANTKVTVIEGSSFASIDDLKKEYPQLFQLNGTLAKL